jgi:hypothetical protein
MTFTETMLELSRGNALARRTRKSLGSVDHNAARAIDCARLGEIRALRESLRAMYRACARIDRNAERDRSGGIGNAFEIAHSRCAEAEIAANIATRRVAESKGYNR